MVCVFYSNERRGYRPGSDEGPWQERGARARGAGSGRRVTSTTDMHVLVYTTRHSYPSPLLFPVPPGRRHLPRKPRPKPPLPLTNLHPLMLHSRVGEIVG